MIGNARANLIHVHARSRHRHKQLSQTFNLEACCETRYQIKLQLAAHADTMADKMKEHNASAAQHSKSSSLATQNVLQMRSAEIAHHASYSTLKCNRIRAPD